MCRIMRYTFKFFALRWNGMALHVPIALRFQCVYDHIYSALTSGLEKSMSDCWQWHLHLVVEPLHISLPQFAGDVKWSSTTLLASDV